jgi:hypothetical protein
MEKGTEMLRNARRMMQSEVLRAGATREELEKSSQMIENVISKHHIFGENITLAGYLINKLKRREVTDKILLALSLMVFFSIVLYVIKVRVFKM